MINVKIRRNKSGKRNSNLIDSFNIKSGFHGKPRAKNKRNNLRGNDFINASRNTLKIDDETKMSPAKTLEYVKTHFTQAVTTTEKYKRVKWYYCTKHIEDPWSTLTYKKSEVTAIMKWLDSGSTVSSLFFCLETLNKASSSTKIYYQQYARDIVFSPLITIPFVDTVNYLDQCSCE